MAFSQPWAEGRNPLLFRCLLPRCSRPGRGEAEREGVLAPPLRRAHSGTQCLRSVLPNVLDWSFGELLGRRKPRAGAGKQPGRKCRVCHQNTDVWQQPRWGRPGPQAGVGLGRGAQRSPWRAFHCLSFLLTKRPGAEQLRRQLLRAPKFQHDGYRPRELPPALAPVSAAWEGPLLSLINACSTQARVGAPYTR